MNPVVPARSGTTWCWVLLILVSPWAQVASKPVRGAAMVLLGLTIGFGILRVLWVSGRVFWTGENLVVAYLLAVIMLSGLIGSLITRGKVDYEYLAQVLTLALMIAVWPSGRIELSSLSVILRWGTACLLMIAVTGIWGYFAWGQQRLTWLYAGSNQAAGVMLVLSFFPLTMIAMRQGVVLAGLSLGATAAAVWLSGSRSVIALLGIVILLVAVLNCFLSPLIRNRVTAAVLLLVVMLAAIAGLLADSGIVTLYELVNKPQATSGYHGRLLIWREFWPRIMARPVFGHGLGDYVLTLESGAAHPHNLYLYLLYRTGLVGLTAFFFAMVALFGSMFRRFRLSHGPAKSFYLVVLVYLCALLVRETVEISVLGNNASVTLLFWEVVLLAFALEHEASELASAPGSSTVHSHGDVAVLADNPGHMEPSHVEDQPHDS